MNASPQLEKSDGLVTLMSGVIHDGQELMRQQLQLFQVEISKDLKRTVNASTFLIVGAFIALLGVLLLLCTAALWLHATWPQSIALWGGFGIVTLVTILVALALIFWGKAKFSTFNPLPDQSVAAIKETMQWKTK